MGREGSSFLRAPSAVPKRKSSKRWEGRLGIWPVVVWYGERTDKGGVCYLRWYVPARRNWRWESCRMKVRDAQGVVSPEAQTRVLELAKRRHDLLLGKVSDIAVEQLAPITVSETWAVLTDPNTGRFPARTPYRDSLEAALDDMAHELGGDFAWLHFDEGAFTRVLRKKVQRARERGHTGHRAAAALGTSLITIMGVLRESKRLPANIAIPGGRRWRKDLLRYVTDVQGGIEPTVQRPRHSVDEMRKILAQAPKVDPRFALLLALGAELRLGQVSRARRSNLDREKGLFRTPGRGDKRGAVIELTAGQRRAVEDALAGYLAPLEAEMADYPLFPQGMLVAKDSALVATPARHGSADPVVRSAINQWFREAERLADVPHIKGRSAYGLRRASVDGGLAEGISPDALQQLGGWSSDRMPQTIYRDQKRDLARSEAAVVRAKTRGEHVAPLYPEPQKPTED